MTGHEERTGTAEGSQGQSPERSACAEYQGGGPVPPEPRAWMVLPAATGAVEQWLRAALKKHLDVSHDEFLILCLLAEHTGGHDGDGGGGLRGAVSGAADPPTAVTAGRAPGAGTGPAHRVPACPTLPAGRAHPAGPAARIGGGSARGGHGAALGAGLRTTRIAELLGRPRTRLTYQVACLRRAGLVTRRPVRGDRRGVEVALTDTARRLLRGLRPAGRLGPRGPRARHRARPVPRDPRPPPGTGPSLSPGTGTGSAPATGPLRHGAARPSHRSPLPRTPPPREPVGCPPITSGASAGLRAPRGGPPIRTSAGSHPIRCLSEAPPDTRTGAPERFTPVPDVLTRPSPRGPREPVRCPRHERRSDGTRGAPRPHKAFGSPRRDVRRAGRASTGTADSARAHHTREGFARRRRTAGTRHTGACVRKRSTLRVPYAAQSSAHVPRDRAPRGTGKFAARPFGGSPEG